jgi:hypothetical protein
LSNGSTTTLKWGTRGMTTKCIVISADQARDVEKVYIEQGDGLKATRIMLNHGSNWDFTIIDDTGITPPAIGEAVDVLDMILSGASANSYAYKGVVIDNNYRAARKQEGHRVLRVESLTLVDVTANGGTAPW